MRHVRLISKTPQAAIANLAGLLQNLIILLQISSQFQDIAASLQEKKEGAS